MCLWDTHGREGVETLLQLVEIQRVYVSVRGGRIRHTHHLLTQERHKNCVRVTVAQGRPPR